MKTGDTLWDCVDRSKGAPPEPCADCSSAAAGICDACWRVACKLCWHCSQQLADCTCHNGGKSDG